MGDNPTSQQGASILDLSSSNIIIGANQIPDLSAIYATQAQLAALNFAPIISPGYNTVLNYNDTSQTFASFNTETVLSTYTLPGNTLGSRGMAKLSVLLRFINSTGAADLFTLFLNWGGTRFFSEAINQAAGSDSAQWIEFTIKNLNATNVQRLVALSGRSTGANNYGTGASIALGADSRAKGANQATKDTTASNVISISGNPATNNAGLSMAHIFSIVELWQP